MNQGPWKRGHRGMVGGFSLWKMRIERPSYIATIIENQDGDFRTQGAGTIPLSIRAIEEEIVYPMSVGDDLSRTALQVSHTKLEKTSLDCVQLSEPPIPASMFPT